MTLQGPFQLGIFYDTMVCLIFPSALQIPIKNNKQSCGSPPVGTALPGSNRTISLLPWLAQKCCMKVCFAYCVLSLFEAMHFHKTLEAPVLLRSAEAHPFMAGRCSCANYCGENSRRNKVSSGVCFCLHEGERLQCEFNSLCCIQENRILLWMSEP